MAEYKKIFFRYFATAFALLLFITSLVQYHDFGKLDFSFSIQLSFVVAIIGGVIGSFAVSSFRSLDKSFEKYQPPNESETKGFRNFLYGSVPLMFTSPYQPEEAARILEANIKTSPILFWSYPEDTVLGKVKVSKVKLIWLRANIGNSFNPVFNGKFLNHENGSVLAGKYSVHWSVRIFMTVWLSGVSLFPIAVVAILFNDHGIKVFQSGGDLLGIGISTFFAILMGAGGIGMIIFAKRASREGLYKITEVVNKSIGSNVSIPDQRVQN